MLYYDNEWKICPFIAHYKAHGKPEFKYTNNKQWWINFVNRWWHHTDLSFTDANPTEAQQTRLDEVNAAPIPEGFQAEASAYVESGLVLNPDNPHFAGFTEQPDLTNTTLVQVYKQAVEQHLDTVAQERDYGSILHLCSYPPSGNPTWKAEGEAGVAWRDAVWAHCYQMLEDVGMQVRTAPSVEELIAELPEIVWPE